MTMSDADRKTRVTRCDCGRAALRARGLPYPGGDACTAVEARGLASLVRWLECHPSVHDEWAPDERAALEWLRAWIDAGSEMIR